MTRLEFLRRLSGWTQEDLARTLGAGFSASAISLMESGRLRPSAKQAARLMEVLRFSADELLADVEPSAL